MMFLCVLKGVACVDLPEKKKMMNRCVYVDNSEGFGSSGDYLMMTRNGSSGVVCPKPRRVSLFNLSRYVSFFNHGCFFFSLGLIDFEILKMWFCYVGCSYQVENCDSGAGSELLDLFLNKVYYLFCFQYALCIWYGYGVCVCVYVQSFDFCDMQKDGVFCNFLYGKVESCILGEKSETKFWNRLNLEFGGRIESWISLFLDWFFW